MAQLKALVPYEIRVNAQDIKSGKLVSNILYYRTGPDGAGGPLAYGTAVPGSSDATFLAAVQAVWVGAADSPLSYLNDSYRLRGFVLRSILGRAWPTPLLAVAGVSSGLTFTAITTAVAHGMSNGDLVQISGVTTPATLNGVFGPITVVNSTQFTIVGTFAGVWSNDGQAQLVKGNQELVYGDRLELADTSTGAIAGEAVPLFCDVSMRRINVGVGRSWKSRISIPCIPETQQQNGRLTVAALALWTATGVVLKATLVNGGVSTSGNCYPLSVSRKIAFSRPTPFSESDTWAKLATSFIPQQNLGSFVRRKPRLTSVIA